MIFKISPSEFKKLKEWQEHIKGVYGEYGKYTYSFTPTGIGNNIEVFSWTANLKLNITDYASW